MTDAPFTETHRATLEQLINYYQTEFAGNLRASEDAAAIDAALAEIDRLARIERACEEVASWLRSFSMPPTATIAEKDEQLAALEAVLRGETP